MFIIELLDFRPVSINCGRSLLIWMNCFCNTDKKILINMEKMLHLMLRSEFFVHVVYRPYRSALTGRDGTSADFFTTHTYKQRCISLLRLCVSCPNNDENDPHTVYKFCLTVLIASWWLSLKGELSNFFYVEVLPPEDNIKYNQNIVPFLFLFSFLQT